MPGQKMRPAFYRLHAVTLAVRSTPADLAAALRDAEAVADRHRLSEGAVYASACRRYLLDTGTPWTRAGDTGDTATAWGTSDHRYRLTARDGILWARCSCGDRQAVDTPDAGDAWHDHHTGSLLRGSLSPRRTP